jgi:chromosome segregation ATPase
MDDVEDDIRLSGAGSPEIESQRSRFSRSAPNSPNLAGDPSHSGSEWTSLLDANSRHALDVSTRAADQQRLLSLAQQEMSELKSLIARKECENARLTIELQSLKSDQQRSDSEFEILKTEYASLQANCAVLKEQNWSLQNRLHQRDRELAEAHQRITQLLSASADSTGQKDSPGRSVPRIAKIEGSSERDSQQLRQQLRTLTMANESRKAHLGSLREHSDQSSSGRRDVLVRKYVGSILGQFQMKMELFESKVSAELIALVVRLKKLKILLGQVALLVQPQDLLEESDREIGEFLARLDKGIKSIASASRAYANSHTLTSVDLSHSDI